MEEMSETEKEGADNDITSPVPELEEASAEEATIDMSSSEDKKEPRIEGETSKEESTSEHEEASTDIGPELSADKEATIDISPEETKKGDSLEKKEEENEPCINKIGPEEKKEAVFFVTRESQENSTASSRKERKHSYVGMRDLTDLERIEEEDIMGPTGTIRGRKNRVRAGLATFQNPDALKKKSIEMYKIIVYTTTFRGVRATFEECKSVISVLYNFRVRVEERDIYMNAIFHNELEERLNRTKVSVPQVFISGQHIGGAKEIEELNESGELRKLLAEFPRQETQSNCKVCGGYKFVPCHKCRGSKNSLANPFTTEFRALKCTYCNQNGLETCPECAEIKKGDNKT